MRILLLTLSTLFNTIPGVGTLLSGLGVPPGYKVIFGAVVEALGVLSLLALWVNREKIKAMPSSTVTIRAIILVIVFLACICCYIYLLGLCVIQHDRGSVYFPIWLDGRIADMVSKAGGRTATITKYGIDAVRQAIEQNANNSLALTTVILLVVYQMIFTALGVSFGLLGFHREDVTFSGGPSSSSRAQATPPSKGKGKSGDSPT